MSSRPNCILEIHQLWQSGFSRAYSNRCCSCWFEPEIIKVGQSSHKMYSNNTLNFQESTTILNACTKMSGNSLKAPRNYHFFLSKYIIYNIYCILLLVIFSYQANESLLINYCFIIRNESCIAQSKQPYICR